MLILALLFVSMAAIVYWVIEWQGKPEISHMTAQTVIETGNEAVNDLMATLNHVDGFAHASASLGAVLPKDTKLVGETFGNLMADAPNNIVGGGIWYNPYAFDVNVDRQAFAWVRDETGLMNAAPQVNDPKQVQDDYYRDGWYIPAMYVSHDHCVWSRAYVDALTGYPMMTCAKAVYGAKNQQFDAVVSFDVSLSNLSQLMQSWQQKTGGYAFLVDLDNRFLTYPDIDAVTQTTELNPQGEMMTVADFAKSQRYMQPIADELGKMNRSLIDKAEQQNASKFNMAATNLMTTANAQRISRDESKILSALLLTNGNNPVDLSQSHFVTAIDIPSDAILQQPVRAFIFTVPFTYWKMVVVKPRSELLAVANTLSKQLQGFLLLGFLPILLLSAYLFRHMLAKPLRQVANNLQTIGQAIAQHRYLELAQHKLSDEGYQELNIISDSVNQLVDKVVESEGALAQINVHLEKKVQERTAELRQAMQELKASQVQLVRSEKMATLGQMVAGVAHEVNTPLGYVRSNLELVAGNLYRYDELLQRTDNLLYALHDKSQTKQSLKQAFDDALRCCQDIKADAVSDELQELLKDGLYGVDQIAELVVSLRDFSRIDESKLKNVNLNDCIRTSLVMARNNIKHIHIQERLQDIPQVHCNPSQINQVCF